MADWSSGSGLKKSGDNPAAPAGLTQTTNRLSTAQERFANGDTQLAPWMPKETMLETAKQWYGGANSEGVTNGWNTDFYTQAFDQQDLWYTKAGESGRGSTWFGWLDKAQNPERTGVATWDDQAKGITFGDVYNGGKKVGNLYDDYDQQTADVMVGEFMLTNDEKMRYFKDPNRAGAYREIIEQRRGERTSQALYAKSAEDFEKNVQSTEDSMNKGWGDDAVVAGASLVTAVGAATATAATAAGAAALGFSWTGPGALVAATIAGTAALVGGTAAYLNKDQLVEHAARSWEKVDLANGAYQTFGVATQELGGLSIQLANPVGNAVKGLYDATHGGPDGGVGDGKAEWYEKTAEGERQTSNIWKIADVAATVADSIFQFASPTNRIFYLTTMGASTVGGGAQLFTGQGFNDRRGQFQDYDGAKQWLAAVGGVFIDAAQMGTAGLLSSAAKSTRQFAGIEAKETVETRNWLTRKGDEAFEKVKGQDFRSNVASYDTINGIRFAKDAQGNVISSRMTLEALVPSEFLRWLPTGWRARTYHASQQGLVTGDDLYRAAVEMTRGQSKFRDAFIAGYAEGGEEFTQAILEPTSFGEQINLYQAGEAALYGAAGGFGMGIKTAYDRAPNQEILKQRGYINEWARTGAAPDPEAFNERWARADQATRERMATSSPDDKDMAGIIETMTEMARMDFANESAVGLAVSNAMRLSAWEAASRRVQTAGDGSLVLMGMINDTLTTHVGTQEKYKYAPNAGMMTAYETIRQLRGINEGMAAQYDSLQAQLRSTQQERDDAYEAGLTREEIQAIDARISQFAQRMNDLERQASVSQQITDRAVQWYQDFTDERDPNRQRQMIDAFNELLRNAFEGVWIDNEGIQLPPEDQVLIQRAVELKMARHPEIDKGSFSILMPQISAELTRINAHATIYIHQSTLKVLGADHDGDTKVPLHDIYLAPEDVQAARRGTQYVREMTSEEKSKKAATATDPDKWAETATRHTVVSDPPDGETAYIRTFHQTGWDPTSDEHDAVVKGLNALVADFRVRYGDNFSGPLPQHLLDPVLEDFKNNVLAGRLDARQALLDELWNLTPGAALDLLKMGDTAQDSLQSRMPEALWQMWSINNTWDSVQRQIAYIHARNQKNVSTINPEKPPPDNSFLKTKARRDAVNAGQALSMLGANDPTRLTQFLHYSSLYQSTVDVAHLEGNSLTSDQQAELTALYANLGAGEVRSEQAQMKGRNAIEDRVVAWLVDMVNSGAVQGSPRPPMETLLLLANTMVPEINVTDTNTYEVTDGRITMLQLLLKKSLEVEEAIHAGTDPESAVNKKIRKLRGLTSPTSEHSYTASTAMVEVLGNLQLHELLGDSALYIGPQTTLNQLVQQLKGLHADSRAAMLDELRRTPDYISHHGTGDPPWPASILFAGEQMNAFTMLVDAVGTTASTARKEMTKKDKRVHQSFLKGHTELRTTLEGWAKTNAERLGDRTKDPKEVLRDLLQHRPEIAAKIGEIIPEAARLGVFQVVGGKLYAAKWIDEFLTEKDSERAAVIYYVNTKFAEFNQLGGTIDPRQEYESGDEPAYKVKYGRIQSRFLQTVYHMATKPDQIDLNRFLKAANSAASLDDLFELINSEPSWRNRRERLLPWHDDVALFEVDPRDVWNPTLPGTLQRENIRGWGESMAVHGKIAVEAATNLEANKTLLRKMKEYQDNPSDTHTHKAFMELLEIAIENRRMFPDTQGQAARDQAIELMQEALIRMHDKGKADEMIRSWGESIVLMDGEGYSSGFRQEVDATAAKDFRHLRTNLTHLVEGPVRVMMPNGATVRMDMSNPKQALAMLTDPRTQGFAIAVLFPTVRDVNDMNVTQIYLDSDNPGNIAEMLKESTYKHLFDVHGVDEEGQRLKLQQAHRYIGTLEAYIRRKNTRLPRDEAEANFAPIQNMINDVVMAYSHSPAMEGRNKASVRAQLVIDIVEAIKATANVETSVLPDLRRTIEDKMRERFLGDTSGMSVQLLSDMEKSFLEAGILPELSRAFALADQELEAEIIAEQAKVPRDQAKIDALNIRITELHDAMDAATNSPDPLAALPQHKFKAVATILNGYRMTGDQANDWIRKGEILSILERKNRLRMFLDKDTKDLIHRVRQTLHTDALALTTITDDEWKMLGEWTMQTVVADMMGRSSSDVAMNPVVLGTEGAQIHKYYDVTWAYLTDTLFDTNVLEGARALALTANHTSTVTSDEASQVIMGGFLNENKLGVWSDRIPMESLKARKVLKGSMVGAAVQLEGNDPKEMADYVGSGWVTYKRPKPEHMSVHAQQLAAGDSFFDTFDELSFVKLQNHFVKDIGVSIGGRTYNLMKRVGKESQVHESVRTSGYKVLDLNELEDEIIRLQGLHPGEVMDITINYVDVDKMPHALAWANNVYFEGVGREATAGAGGGAIASLFFGLGALSKLGQQNPLDMAAKKGKGFRQHITSTLTEIEAMETRGTPIAEVLAQKALHLWNQEYEHGPLLTSDLPALYKLMKMRHVIVGTDATGTKQVWWPQQYIEAETKAAAVAAASGVAIVPPLDNMQLVPLSDSVAQTLLGGGGHLGVRGAMTRPVFNLADMDRFPLLTEKRLTELGLTRLGEDVDVADSEFAQVSTPPKAVMTMSRGKAVRSRYQAQVEMWRGQKQTIIDRRSDKRKEGAGKFDIDEINKAGARKLEQLLSPSTLADLFQKLGVPTAGLIDLASLDVSMRLVAQLSKVRDENNNAMIWQHMQSKGQDLSRGVLGRADVQDNFRQTGGVGPVFGDIVVIDLEDMLAAAGGDWEEAVKQGKETLRAYADRGLVISFASAKGDFKFQNELAEWMRGGSIGYRPMNSSSHFFVPLDDNPDFGTTRLSLESTLTEVTRISAQGVALGFVSDTVMTDLSENASIVDFEHDTQWNRVTHTILPTALVATGSVGDNRQYSANVPAKGLGEADQVAKLREILLPILMTDEGLDHLIQQASGYQKPLAESGEPKGANIQKVYKDANGKPTGIVDPGILGIREALEELRDLLQANQYPLENSRVLQTGSFIPLITQSGGVIMSRVGFRPPDMAALGDRMNAPLGAGKAVKGETPLNIAMFTDELDPNQSVPPPFMVNEVRFDDERGLTVRGEFKLNAMSKMVLEGVGFKAGVGPLPDWLRFPPNVLSGRNQLRVTQLHSETSVIGKQGVPWLMDNYRNAFAVTGFSAKKPLLDFFYPGRDPVNEGRDWNDLEIALRAWSIGNNQFSASDIDRALDAGTYADTFQNEINQVGEKLNPGTWQPVDLTLDKGNPDPRARLVGIIMATLAAPGISVEDVVETAGLMTVSDRSSDAQITLLPPLMADALADPSYPELREMLHAQINGALKEYSGSDNYFLDQAWNFHMNMEVHGQPAEYQGYLMINLPIPANENAVSLAQASLTSGGQASAHNARVAAGAIGGWTALKPAKKGRPDPLDELFGENAVMRFEQGSGELLWDALRRIQMDDKSYTPWQRNLPLESMKLKKGRDKVGAHTLPIDKSDWGDDAVRVQEAQDDFLAKLNLSGDHNRVEVDYLVRQFTGRPGPLPGQKDYHEAITAKVYLQVVTMMKANLKNNMQPLHGGAVPLPHRSFWEMLVRAQHGLSEDRRFKMVSKEGKGRKRKYLPGDASWADWVDALMGQVRNSNEPFHSMFREDLDGFWHTYNGATPSFSEMALSTDEMIAMKLMDPELNELYLSLDPGEDAVLKNPILLDAMEMTYAALIGHEPGYNQRDARDTPASSLSDQLDQQEAWLKNNKMAKQDEMSVRDYVKEGAHYRESNRATNGLLRGAVNLSITMRLANPALYFSALFEVPFRNLLEHTTNLLTGQHIGMGGKWVATAGEGGLTALLNVESKFSRDEIAALRGLAKQLGNSNEFLAELYGEMIYQGYVEPGAHKSVGKLLERTAQATARMTSDPRWGMTATSVATRYLEAAWEYMSLTDSLVTVPQFIQMMEKDPMWLRENSPKGRFSAHRAGMNRVAQVRSTKATVLGNAIMAPIESMGASSSASVNFAGHLLKIPMLFTRFNANAFMTLSGLSSIDQVFAMFLDGRKRPKVLNRMAAIARQENYDPEALDTYDMSHVIESVDLSRAFVKGAVTHTGLMTMGMMLGSLGLGGEDDEEARRRRLSQYLNIPNNRDPRKAVNDFLWADAIFLDSIPGLKTIFKNETGHSAVVPHWMFRQFLSPVLGMMKFFETGNIAEIKYGFLDAASVMPNSIMRLWNEADMTANMLSAAAKDAELEGTPEAQSAVTQFIINTVGVYEKALVENSFVNSVINSMDEWDRNPWVVPKTADENTGELDREQGTDVPVQTDAMRAYVTEDGKSTTSDHPWAPPAPEEGMDTAAIKQGYLNRTGTSGMLHQYAENNHTFAAVMSLFTGLGDSSYLRDNMTIKQETVRVEEASQAEAEALVLSQFSGLGGQRTMTKDEIIRALKQRDQDADVFWDQAEIENEADSIYDAQSRAGGMSLLEKDKDGVREVITQAGARGVYQSLQSGLIAFGHPSLQGINVSREMRDKIAEEWNTELIQEGVDLGLGQQAAEYRAKRIWAGDFGDPDAPGLRALLYDPRIPYKQEIKYNQLNTTYMLGPDGRPWATPFQRQNLLQAAGVPLPHRMHPTIPGVTSLDQRGNTVDLVAGVNTGLKGLVPTVIVPQEDEKPDDKPFEAAAAKSYTPSRKPYRFKRGGYGGGGGGGGSDYGPPFIRMQPLPGGTAPRNDGIPMINTNTPYIRRAQIHRERIQGERGRLKQWQ